MASRTPAFKTEFKVAKGELLLVAPSDVLVDQAKNPRGEEITPESVADMRADMQAHGQVQAVVLRRLADGTLAVIAGFRRVLAGQMLQAEDADFRLKAEVVTVNDEEAFILGIRENAFRQDVNPLANAVNMRRLIEQYGWDEQRVADLYRVNIKRVREMLSVLGLPANVRKKIAVGSLSLGQALLLTKLNDDTATAVVEQAEMDVSTDPNGCGPKATRMKSALREALRQNGVAKPRQAGELLKLISGRNDAVSVAITAFLKGTGEEGAVFEALDACEAPVCRSAEYAADRPAAAPAEAPRAAKPRKAKPAKPPVRTEADSADFEPAPADEELAEVA